MATSHNHLLQGRESTVSQSRHHSQSSMIVRAGIWSVLAFALNLIWEIAHVSLYTLWDEADPLTVVRALVHCTLGDAAIALAAFALAGIVLRQANWPEFRPRTGSLIVVIGAMAFTAWSEWYNVYQIGSWAYTASMPLLFGIGISPLLQWLILPPLLTIAYRMTCQRLHGRNSVSTTIPLHKFSGIRK